MIRKSGWLIFLVLVAIILALVYLFAGMAIRAGMVFSLEKAVGAEVNIARVSVSLAPLALNINDLQVTDRGNPAHNTVSFKRANAALEVWPALLGYYVINDLSIDGLVYGSKRSSPGKVYRSPDVKEEDRVDLTEMLQLDFPDVDELLARANLQTLARGQALQQQANRQQQQITALGSELPNREALESIEAEIDALTDSTIEGPADLAAKTEQLRELQETLRSKRDQLRQVQRGLAQSRDELQAAVAELHEARAADWQHLQQLANIDEGGIAPISQILLGDLWGERIGQLEGFYRLVQPYLPEGFGPGDAVEPRRTLPNRILPLPGQPYPDFWVRDARVNWFIGGGEATISMQDITGQHHLIGAATQIHLQVQDLPRLAAFTLQGDFEVLEQMVTNLSWQLDGFALESMEIGGGDSALNLAAGMLAASGSMTLVDSHIEQQAQVILAQPDFSSGGNRYIQQLAELLNQQDRIPLSLEAKGLISAPSVSVRSPLDGLIGDALLGEAREQIVALENNLRNQLDTKLEAQLEGQADWRALLDQQDAEADALQNRIDEMLAARLGDVQEGVRDRVRDRLRGRLGDDNSG